MAAQAGNVLIIDNNQTHRSNLSSHLEQLGYKVVAAEDGRQAFDLLAKQQFKLIFLSISMWGVNSYQILERLKGNELLSNIPVLLLTPADNTLGIERWFELGVADYLPEPFVPAVLKARIDACLARQELHEHEQEDREREELLKIERDVQIARQIQLGFLPPQLPQPPGWEIAARFHPAREVAGDFYDVFMLTQNRRVGLVIADVCDKGVGAALFMSLSRSLIRAFAQQHYALSWMDALADNVSTGQKGARSRHSMLAIGTNALKNAVVLTNNYITHNHLEMNMFFTLFFGVLDPTAGTLLYVNGGHCLPVIARPDGTRVELEITGPAVGLFPDVDFGIAQAQLEPGDILFCYTDGVTDARNPEREFFGKERVHQLIAEQAPSAVDLLNRFEQHLHTYIAHAEQFDDITMLSVRRLPPDNPLA